MRKSKYMTDAVSMIREALESGVTAQCMTDKDAFLEMNDLLRPYGQKICYRTYQRYKAAAMSFGEMAIEEQEKFDPVFQELYITIQREQLQHKKNLYGAMMESDGNGWHMYKWILERKFPDFNLRKATEKHLEEAMLEKRLLELDLMDMGILPAEPAKEDVKAVAPTEAALDTEIPKGILPQKPVAQVRYEKDARMEVESAVPPDERPLFRKYWDCVQQDWDKANPIFGNYKFDQKVVDEMRKFYQIRFLIWADVKEDWMEGHRRSS